MLSFSRQTRGVVTSLRTQAKKMEQETKQEIVEELKNIVSQNINAARTPREKQGVINAAKSALRNVQRHLNYNGPLLFHKHRYNQGNVDEGFFSTLMAEENRDNLREICTPDSMVGVARDRVAVVSSLFGKRRTCYTEYAKNLRVFLDDWAKYLDDSSMTASPILNVPENVVVGVRMPGTIAALLRQGQQVVGTPVYSNVTADDL